MTPTFSALLLIHIIFGFTSISAAVGAISTKKGGTVHRFCGKVFVCGMTGIFITAIPLSLMKNDLFLFLIALLSYYLALSGWLFAKNRSGVASLFAWSVATIMLA